jgi:hypothetical protein
MPERNLPGENLLPFRTEKSELYAQSGKESDIYKTTVKDSGDQYREIALKENRKVELADPEQMLKLKQFYDFLKNDPNLGKFVIESGFVKAQRSAGEPAKAFIVQKFIPGKRIDEITDKEISSDRQLASELLEFVRACIIMLEASKAEPKKVPDLYADKKFFLGNLLHNPRYTGNLIISDRDANLSQRVHFVDAGSLSGPAKEYGKFKNLLYPVDLKLQLIQLRRWEKKLEQSVNQKPRQ